MAFTTLTVGHLNILTITFAPILIGLAIDYGVHLISRYEEELRHGKTEQAALTKAMVFTGPGHFHRRLHHRGRFPGDGLHRLQGHPGDGDYLRRRLLICLIPMMTLLPVLLLKGRQNVIDHEQGDLAERRARIENIWLQRPGLGRCPHRRSLCRRGNAVAESLFRLQPAQHAERGPASGRIRKETHSRVQLGPLRRASIATNLQQAVALEQQLTNLPAVAGVDSMTQFLAEDQTRNWRSSPRSSRPWPPSVSPTGSQPGQCFGLSATLYSLYGYLGLALKRLSKKNPALSKQLLALRQAIDEPRARNAARQPSAVQTNALKLAEFQQALFEDVRDTFQALQNQDNAAPLRVQDLPQALRNRFVGVTGKYLLMVYPKERCLGPREPKGVYRANCDRRSRSHRHPGATLSLHRPAQGELRGGRQVFAGGHCAAGVDPFPQPARVVLALIPVAIGSLWLGGLMGFFGMPFNPANIMTLPLVIGIGVTNGIHILNRFAEEQTPSILARSTGKAVLFPV